MLKNIDPILCPDLLYALREMGHGDEIAIVDANYPASAGTRRVIRQPGVDSTRMMEAILSVMPLENDDSMPAWRMVVGNDEHAWVDAFDDFRTMLEANSATPTLRPLARQDFYARARGAFLVVATGDRRHYANVILTKAALPEV